MESLCAKQTRTDSCCSKQTHSFLPENFDFSWFWADVPFRGVVLNDAQTRRPMAQVSAAHTASTCLGSSRSLHLPLRSTARSFQQVTWRPVKHRFIEFCLIAISFIPFGTGWLEHLKRNTDDELSHVFDIKVWKWNCLSARATSPDLGCLVKWRVPLFDELNFEELAFFTWKVSMLNCHFKKNVDRNAPMRRSLQGLEVQVKLKHQPGKSTGRKRSHEFCLTVGTVCCMWMRVLNLWCTNFGSAKCCTWGGTA